MALCCYIMERYELTDEHWALIEPRLPAQRRTTPGGVWRDHRTVVNGIFWILFSGAAWRDMPARYGPCKTAYDRFRRWQRDGTWDRVLSALRLTADARGLLDYTQYNADSTSVRATRAAGGAQKKVGRRRWA
jgi:transposase